MAEWGTHRSFTNEQATQWRAEYDADEALRVVDLAERHQVDAGVMRSALVWAGGALRAGVVTRAARREAGLPVIEQKQGDDQQ